MAEYLAAVLEEAPDDVAYLAKALGDIARVRGMSEVAKATGISRPGLYKALCETGSPSLETAMKVLAALGLRLSVQTA